MNNIFFFDQRVIRELQKNETLYTLNIEYNPEIKLKISIFARPVFPNQNFKDIKNGTIKAKHDNNLR